MDLRRAREAVIDAHSKAESARRSRRRDRDLPPPALRDRPDRRGVRRRGGRPSLPRRQLHRRPGLQGGADPAHHGDQAVAEEAWVSGTHLGTYHGSPPTGRFVRVRVCGIYVFEEDRLVCERVYYDLLIVLRGLGIARDPDSIGGQLTTLLNHPSTWAGPMAGRGCAGGAPRGAPSQLWREVALCATSRHPQAESAGYSRTSPGCRAA